MTLTPDIILNMENLTFEYPSSAKHKTGVGFWRAIKWKSVSIKFREGRLLFRKENIRACLTKENLKLLAVTAAKQIMVNVIPRAIFSFIFAFLIIISILSWQNTIPWAVSIPVSGVLALLVSIFFTVSVTFRCVVVLSIPQFTTQQGRFVLLFVISALLLGGPLVSLAYNTNQAAYSLSCMANMTAKQGRALTESYRKAYVEMTESFNRTVTKLKKAKASVEEKVLRQIEKLHGQLESLRKSILTELENCDSVMDLAREDCMVRSSAAYENCLDVTSGLKLDFLCELVKIAPGICDKGLKNLCLPVKGITILVREISKVVKELEDSFRFKVNYENNLGHHVNSSANDTVIQESIKVLYKDTYEIMLSFVLTIKYLFLASIFLVPFKSWLYLRRVLSLNRRGLSFFDRFPVFNERQRQREFLLQILMLLLHFMLTMAVFTFDFILYWIESAVEEGGSITFSTESEIGFNLDLKLGGGLLWNPFWDEDQLFDSLGVEMRGKHKFFTSTIQCLPSPMSPSGIGFIGPILVLYIMTILFLITGNKLLKLRGDIIAYFFPAEVYNLANQPSLIPF